MRSILGLVLCVVHVALGGVHDCWDPEKLRRMKFSSNQDQNMDSGLSQFSKMVQCLTAQGKGIGGSLEQDWNQWAKVAGGRSEFVPKWTQNNPNQNAPNWRQPNNNNYGQKSNTPRFQPEPGVQPEDWGRVKTVSQDNDWDSQNRKLGPDPKPDLWDKESVRNRKQRKKERKLEEKRRRMQMENPNLQQRYDQATWNNPNPVGAPGGTDYSFMTPEETAEVSLRRKYGYIIMALSVVVLAVLMVATIFCCNSSNSTMSQAANQNLPVNQFDNYSIYSYKGGPVGDTLRSTGTLGGMSMHTETLKSVQSRGSPQYRVSDIDPDFARRFKETQQY